MLGMFHLYYIYALAIFFFFASETLFLQYSMNNPSFSFHSPAYIMLILIQFHRGHSLPFQSSQWSYLLILMKLQLGKFAPSHGDSPRK